MRSVAEAIAAGVTQSEPMRFITRPIPGEPTMLTWGGDVAYEDTSLVHSDGGRNRLILAKGNWVYEVGSMRPLARRCRSRIPPRHLRRARLACLRADENRRWIRAATVDDDDQRPGALRGVSHLLATEPGVRLLRRGDSDSREQLVEYHLQRDPRPVSGLATHQFRRHGRLRTRRRLGDLPSDTHRGVLHTAGGGGIRRRRNGRLSRRSFGARRSLPRHALGRSRMLRYRSRRLPGPTRRCDSASTRRSASTLDSGALRRNDVDRINRTELYEASRDLLRGHRAPGFEGLFPEPMLDEFFNR